MNEIPYKIKFLPLDILISIEILGLLIMPFDIDLSSKVTNGAFSFLSFLILIRLCSVAEYMNAYKSEHMYIRYVIALGVQIIFTILQFFMR